MDISNYNIEQCDAVSVLNAILDAYDRPTAKQVTLQQGIASILAAMPSTSGLATEANATANKNAIIAAMPTPTTYHTVQMTSTTASIDPNKVYIWGEVTSLNISLNTGQSGVANVYMLEFYSGNTPTSLTLPQEITDVRGSILGNTIVNVCIFNNIAYIA